MTTMEARMADEGGERRRGKLPGWAWGVLGVLGFVPVLILTGFLLAHVHESGGGETASLAVFAIPVAYIALIAWFSVRGVLRTRVVEGRRRPASAAQVATATMVAALFAGMAIGVLAAVTDASDAGPLQHPAAFSVMMAAMLFAGWATVIYYRRLDEAALEAHKFAWLWGAQSGLFLATCAAFYAMTHGDGGTLAEGVILAVTAATLGYGVAWGVWWLRKR